MAALVSTMLLGSAVARAERPSSNDEERRMQAQSLLDEAAKVLESDPQAALEAYRASYDISPDFHVLYNMGIACVRLGDARCAKRSFDGYLREGGDKISLKRRKEIDAQLSTVARPGALVITSRANDAEVRVDGAVVGRTPLARPIPVAGGSHKVSILVNGAPTDRTVRVAPGETQKIDVAPSESSPRTAAASGPAPAPAPSAPASATPPAAHPPPEKRGGVPVVPWAIAGALAAGTVATGVLTFRANERYDALHDVFPISRDELDAAYSKTRNLLILTGALGGATLISLGVAGYKTLFRGASSSPSREPDPRIGVAIGPAGIAIGGRL